jgi:SAM-dependent methyltransferase
MSGFMNPAEFANIRQAEENFWWYRGMRDILFRLAQPHLEGRRITRALEAGCGTGYLSHLLQRERGLPVVPLDYSGDGLRYARELGVRDPVQGDIRGLPFGNGAFDLVLSIDCIAHLPRGEEAAAASELARVLAPGGLLVLRTSALDILRSRHGEFAHERQRFTRRRLTGLFASAGIRILRCTYANSLLMPIALAKFRLIEPLSRAPAESGVQPVAPWLDRFLYRHLALEAAWIGAGANLPIGQSLLLIGTKAAP